ncbi:hypothetical protein BXA19_11980 [Corynebacterium diphtheriae]|nr:hypothetical protein BUE67_12230 [Corynebacterium diphtheriae]OLO13402.1 hypothetical protein BUV99_12075 [Corynebacterium diphtheriae]OLO20912.1 hypothetical protein BVH78_11885 [Corynebacterium diphtheriae]OLO20938.1 hypothetical protein BVH76_11900 [Corynebacterium diphtheriae]OMO43109.1 hypothetical protein BVL41_12365 [Corynebacterium diphtheriae]
MDHSVFGILVKFSLACSKIFPSTQTEQDLGHFTMPLRGYEYGRLIGTLSHVYPPEEGVRCFVCEALIQKEFH